MKGFVIVASDGNPDYEFYLPLAGWAWRRLGWEMVTLRPAPFGPYRPVTVAQVSRLYAAAWEGFGDDDLLMTSDADMIPLADHWHPDPAAITTFGHDLTGYRHVPICYVAMAARNWRRVMELRGHDLRTAMERDLRGTKALSGTWPEWWLVDQDIITRRLRPCDVTSVARGTERGTYLASGRLDRVAWRYPRALVDLHAPKTGWEHWPRIMRAVRRAFGEFPEHLVHHDEDFIRGQRPDDAPTDPGRLVCGDRASPSGATGAVSSGPSRSSKPAAVSPETAGGVHGERPAVPFTALVVTLNEADRLADCLESLRFCNELLVVDLGSSDASTAIARAAGAEVVPHARVAIPELLWEEMFARARNDWIVLADPDEVMPPDLAGHLLDTMAREPNAGLLYVPIRFYFRGRPVVNTFWGHVGVKRLVLHRGRTRPTGHVHGGVELRPGFSAQFVPGDDGWCVRHYWVDTFGQLFEKHWRYVRLEGAARYGRGERFTWRLFAWTVRDTLRRNLFTYGGIRGGPRDWFLSVFHTAYVAMAMLSLRRHERSLLRPTGRPSAG